MKVKVSAPTHRRRFISVNSDQSSAIPSSLPPPTTRHDENGLHQHEIPDSAGKTKILLFFESSSFLSTMISAFLRPIFFFFFSPLLHASLNPHPFPYHPLSRFILSLRIPSSTQLPFLYHQPFLS